jgi:hypothetical protein
MNINRATLLGTAASLLVLAAVAKPAFADVFVNVTATKTQDVTETDTITKTKTVTITVTAPGTQSGAAEADAVVNVKNTDILVNGGHNAVPTGTPLNPLTTNFNLQKNATIDSSINTNTGIVGVNQDVGNFANQANVVSFALTRDPAAVTDSKALVSQDNDNSNVYDTEHFNINANMRAASITSSINGNTGITGVNQNAGNANNQTNAVAAAVGDGANVALADAALGQVNSNLYSQELGTVRREDITDSVNTNTGITQVNQSNGNFNNQGSVVSISAISSAVGLSQAP